MTDFASGMGLRLGDWIDDDELTLVYVSDFTIGYYKADNTYFLQKVIHYPGSYCDPPSEDFRNIITNASDFKPVALELVRLLAIQVFEIMAENYYFEDNAQELDTD
jgi:hypothetical protein